ncbi:Amino acid transporter [Hyphomicrobiales bacterium]|nr:Amino acid transporter [Hyphomicrobiales bacterium]CAH1668383.1 Amino acid transporter [Hyphomicrobiales bacterium]
MSLVHNERTKLTATYANGIAIAVLAIGYIGPVVSVISSGRTPSITDAVIANACNAFSFALHLGARWWLGRLR